MTTAIQAIHAPFERAGPNAAQQDRRTQQDSRQVSGYLSCVPASVVRRENSVGRLLRRPRCSLGFCALCLSLLIHPHPLQLATEASKPSSRAANNTHKIVSDLSQHRLLQRYHGCRSYCSFIPLQPLLVLLILLGTADAVENLCPPPTGERLKATNI